MSKIKFSYSCYVDISGLTVEEKEELIRYLEDIGYVFATPEYSQIFHLYDEIILENGYMGFPAPCTLQSLIYAHGDDFINFINCGKNIPLFKSVAAINEDNDYMQHLICTLDNGKQGNILCKSKKYDITINNMLVKDWCKATIDELFKFHGEERV